MTLRIGSMFSGYGGLDLAAESFFGAETAWHVEFDKAPSRILEARWPGVPNYGDVTAVDWSAVEPVDILTGGFPCQDLSLAGRRQGMRPGTRSGLWADYVKAIDALNPSVVVIENVRGLLSGCAEGGTNADGSPMEPCQGCVGDGEHRPVLRALGRVLGDLADLGFDAEWAGIRASDVGAPHGRFRVFVLAYSRRILGEGRFAGSGEAARGRASAVAAGRGGAPVSVLLPTPAAMNPNEEEDLEQWEERRARVKLDKGNGNGFGTPLGVAVRQEWGQYEPAVRRWEAVTRPAPAPTIADGKNAQHRLNAAFAEWMMGVPAGWITDPAIGITRREQMKACGNGVVPQQAYAAIEGMWPRVAEAVA